MRKIVTKKRSSGRQASRKATSCNSGTRREKKQGSPKKMRTTKIVTADSNATLFENALEELLIAFAHGNQERLQASLLQLCDRSQVERLNSKASELLQGFHASIWSLRNGFDTTNLSMTSTSLPDASKKLDKVLVQAGDAAQKVLTLVEQQEAIQLQGEQLLLGLERQLSSGNLDRRTLEEGLAECRSLVSQTRKIASEMVYTQDFEDLCGQVIYKVRHLIITLEEQIRGLLLHLKVDLPARASECQGESNQGMFDQSSVDDLLKNFGL